VNRDQTVLLTVRYPIGADRLVLRTARDWDRDLEPREQSTEHAVFDLQLVGPSLALKPCLVRGGSLHWSRGNDFVVHRHDPDPQIWPFFFGSERGSLSDWMHFERDGLRLDVRLYLPPGYGENCLRTYPVLYMQDGRNLFLAHEAFAGREWQVDESMDRLEQMHAARRTIVVGIAPGDRMRDYTRPGYEAYGELLVQVIKPTIDATYRTRSAARDTVVMGSSLGGVVSLYLAWQHPHVFGNAGCLSSTFGYGDDLYERIATEARRPIRVYLDSGWPADNFHATNAMRDLLISRGYRLGTDLIQFSFPEGRHNEESWSSRVHLPFQFFFGRAWTASRASE
jgi:predicted alpha/beta superfamily hydrolase